ncbi:MAG: SPOR domain-containing protein [Candidatus Omnitrophica bacterium]|nr:SPOR domain-containing protein [Candidatus Omnitrophota bacterium]MDD5552765.1 SPOR domain-containing protein [Candidatus Omnitrophota bacterium]
MEKTSQLELFDQQGASVRQHPRASFAFWGCITKYEKTILLIIAFAVTGIASFALGVEKGKNYATPKTDSRLDLAARPPAAETRQAPARFISAPAEAVSKEQPAPTKILAESFTVQVASFSSNKNAQKEADALKKKGHSALVLSKGKFSIVCVGKFSKRSDAEMLLAKLRNKYQDCRLRRL